MRRRSRLSATLSERSGETHESANSSSRRYVRAGDEEEMSLFVHCDSAAARIGGVGAELGAFSPWKYEHQVHLRGL